MNAFSRPGDRSLSVRNLTAGILLLGLSLSLGDPSKLGLVPSGASGSPVVVTADWDAVRNASLPFLPASADAGLKADDSLDDALEYSDDGFAVLDARFTERALEVVGLLVRDEQSRGNRLRPFVVPLRC